MDERSTVALASLSSSFTTRRRGEEAYMELQPMLRAGPVVLDLDDVEVLSVSFLDGLLLGLINCGHINSVIFRTSNARTRTRLERLSGLRAVDIRSLDSRGEVEKLKRRQPYQFEPRFSEGKAAKVSG